MREGAVVQISTACNPNHVGSGDWVTCDYHDDLYDGCIDTWNLIIRSRLRSDGILETGLSCPQCGCGENGALKITDLPKPFWLIEHENENS